MICFSPFTLEATIAARVSVEYEGVDLANVGLDFVLTGPTPWQARGHATFEILRHDVKKSFSFLGKRSLVRIAREGPRQRLVGFKLEQPGFVPEEGLQIEGARITTEKGAAIDTFSVLGHGGWPVTDSAALDHLLHRLKGVVSR